MFGHLLLKFSQLKTILSQEQILAHSRFKLKFEENHQEPLRILQLGYVRFSFMGPFIHEVQE